VVEGWHGVPYGKPVTRLKEYIQVMKQIFARESALQFDGKEYQIPYRGPGATNLGKPLKSIMVCEDKIPIYAATLTPAGVQAAAEVADGFFPIWMDPDQYSVFKDPIEKGLKAAGGGKSLKDFDVAPFVTVIIGDDVKQCMVPIRGNMALYIGGMGARGKNFYNDYAKRLGYEEAAVKIQDLYLDGKKMEAMAAVPDSLVDEVALLGPRERIKDRLAAWKSSPVGTLCIGSGQVEALRTLAELVL
jgi:F420-dependent oxidoreductase-like protein